MPSLAPGAQAWQLGQAQAWQLGQEQACQDGLGGRQAEE